MFMGAEVADMDQAAFDRTPGDQICPPHISYLETPGWHPGWAQAHMGAMTSDLARDVSRMYMMVTPGWRPCGAQFDMLKSCNHLRESHCCAGLSKT